LGDGIVGVAVGDILVASIESHHASRAMSLGKYPVFRIRKRTRRRVRRLAPAHARNEFLK
jgi:hypothetical protein